jgi:D-alanine transaminase/branched-chain amino acid aminotransferase
MGTSGTHALLNGRIIDASEATLSVQDRELQYGFGVYESLRVLGGKVVYPIDHIERLFFSADGIGLRHTFTASQVHSWLETLLAYDHVGNATVRILLMGGIEARLFITTSTMLDYPESFYREGIKTIGYRGERMLPQYKTCSLLMNYLALRKASTEGAFEALLIDRNNLVLEGTRSNVFACKGEVVHTAPSNEVLEGVTRDKILKAIGMLGYSLRFEAPSERDLADGVYDEVFISSTSMGAMPVASFDSHRFTRIGTIAAPIHQLIRRWEVDALH